MLYMYSNYCNTSDNYDDIYLESFISNWIWFLSSRNQKEMNFKKCKAKRRKELKLCTDYIALSDEQQVASQQLHDLPPKK